MANLNSIVLDGFDINDEDYVPSTEDLLSIWDAAQVENGGYLNRKPTHAELIALWKETVSAYKTTFSGSQPSPAKEEKGSGPHETPSSEELRAAFNQMFEDLNGTDFKVVQTNLSYSSADDSPSNNNSYNAADVKLPKSLKYYNEPKSINLKQILGNTFSSLFRTSGKHRK
mgnify:CR=1 FL=1